MKSGHPQRDTRSDVLRVAHDLFMRYGYRAVSTRRIAEACGITQPALYHHFKNKENLYVEVLQHAIRKANEKLESRIRRQRDPYGKLVAAAGWLLAAAPERLDQMLRDIERELRPDKRQKIRDLWKAGFLAPIAGVFSDAWRSGEWLRPASPGIDEYGLAHVLLMLVHQHAAYLRTEDRTPNENDARHIVELLLYGLAPRPG